MLAAGVAGASVTFPRGIRGAKVPLADRFWDKVDMSGGPDACWPWQAARSESLSS